MSVVYIIAISLCGSQYSVASWFHFPLQFAVVLPTLSSFTHCFFNLFYVVAIIIIQLAQLLLPPVTLCLDFDGSVYHFLSTVICT